MKVELLAPAGDMQAAIAALTSGADAVYLGLKKFSARSSAENFDVDSLQSILRLAHLLEAKVYVALNTLVKDDELDAFFESARAVWNMGADAILVQDLFLGRALKRRYPEIVLHLSTQAGCCNVYGAQLAKEYGFSRVVLARETPIADMVSISQVIETEIFVQGALCSAFSGQCYFSSFAGNNSGNRGRCKQPCRKQYTIDRAGYEGAAYALSTSDLMAAPRLKELLAAGVISLKIEGRMRRPEYVGAAVKYYRALLGGAPAEEAFSMLRRTYNRGDYTEGLAFGQAKSFLSRKVQGHIGEEIGTISFRHGMPFCRTSYAAERGDGFKILRDGKEVGGAVFSEALEGGIVLSSKEKLKVGDAVRITTSQRSNTLALLPVKSRTVHVKLQFFGGEAPKAECEGMIYAGDTPLAVAERAPLTEAELHACFQKTDSLPFTVEVECETCGAFMPKSALNAFRRAFYEALVKHLCPMRPPLPLREGDVSLTIEEGKLTAQIAETPQGSPDIFVYKPQDYAKLTRPERKNVYLYLPPFFTREDERVIAEKIGLFDGIYCEGYYGIKLAEKYGVALFAGTGFNLTNRYAVSGVREVAKYFALSKEISAPEQDALSASGAFVLADGDIKLMDLIYCPFERTCNKCDRKQSYRLTDEGGRVFPLRRYRFSGMVCRFEVYNCAILQRGNSRASRIYDASAGTSLGNKTKGHAERSML
ncbi:MAG: U32 family peptidase [Clostridia bacterium]|nr:U32 family peptidase [Clostridia bacterium]